MSTPSIFFGIGEILWDMLQDGRQMGGAPTNFAFDARALGAASVIVSAVGDDESGLAILAELESRGLDRSGISRMSAIPTAMVTVVLDVGGISRSTIHEGVAWDAIPWSTGLDELAACADAVCLGSRAQRSPVSRATIGAFLAETRLGFLRILDHNLRQSYFSRDIIVGLLCCATVLRLNDEELWIVSLISALPRSESQALAGLLEAYPLSLIALTTGPSGSRLFGRGVNISHPGSPVETADTVGASDVYTWTLVAGFLRKRSWEEIGDPANRVTGYACSRKVAWPDLPAELTSWPRA